MSINEEQIKAAENERLALARKERAEAFLAQQKANEERAWYLWLRKHCGQQAVNSKIVFNPSTANVNLMTETIKAANEQITEDSLEAAWQKLTAEGRLAAHKPGQYVLQTVGKLFPDQKRSEAAEWNKAVPMPQVLVGVTKREIRTWGTEKLRSVMRLPGGTLYINKILSGEIEQ